MTPGSGARTVTCELGFEVAPGTVLALQVAAVAPQAESLVVTLDDAPVDVEELAVEAGGRAHVVRAGPGALAVTYSATVPARSAPDAGPELDAEALTALRQSRYCPSDALMGFARVELTGATPAEVGEWVHARLAYELGVSTSQTTAIDTLGAGSGACRDFAHVTITLLRALGIPARLVAVYAPGLDPMDFHAVTEARVGGAWEVVDATRLAPRSSLVRIATGRDAADTAFASTVAGDARLLTQLVIAVVEGDLPADDHTGLARLP